MKNPQQTKRKIVAITILVVTALTLLLGAFPRSADAHASTTTTSPANGAALGASPQTVSVSFNEPVTTDASRVQLVNSTGRVVPSTWRSVDAGKRHELLPIKALAPGSYALRWSVTSEDGHIVTGAASFNVRRADAAKRNTRVKLSTGGAGTDLTIGTNKAGRTTVTATGRKFTTIEFTNKTLGATLRYPFAGGTATVVLPIKGAWTVTAIEKPSEYTETRWTGSFKLG